MSKLSFFVFLFFAAIFSAQHSTAQEPDFVKEHYIKMDTTIAMRDGIKLYTIVYIPKDSTEKHPFLMERTPYSVAPYGAGNYRRSLGPSRNFLKENYIFVYQDVRGRYMSEGVNKEMTPFIPDKKNNQQVDESSDTYDTVDWLLKNIGNNNGRVGLYGISYPGFYATASLPDAHPAIKAVSPQAPVTDEFIGDDANHNGAFFLMDNFDFMNYFGKPVNGPVQDYGGMIFNAPRKDAYDFFLKLGPLKNTQSPEYFDHKSTIWNEYLAHDTYDEYWKSRNIRTHLKNIHIPTLVVGGWFDAEDLFGALHTYEAIVKQGGGNSNYLVMGPWTHGAWARPDWSSFGTYNFQMNTSKFFQDSLQTTFFNYYLKDKGAFTAAKATIFETGTNEWKRYQSWPPENTTPVSLYLKSDKRLSFEGKSAPAANSAFTQYVSDPAKPVPYTGVNSPRRNNEYMVEDQRFAASRPDVLVFQTNVLDKDMTVAGEIIADLFVSTSGTDADFIVKIIDVLPENESKTSSSSAAGLQRLVRAEVMRGKFRNSYENPEPFIPNKISEVKILLNDVDHSFKKGHRIMVQIQSSWFPLVDRNPQKFMNIPSASEKDFQKSTIRIFHDAQHLSKIIIPVLP